MPPKTLPGLPQALIRVHHNNTYALTQTARPERAMAEDGAPQRPPEISVDDWAALPLDIKRELAAAAPAPAPAAAAAAKASAVINLVDDDEEGEEDAALQEALRLSERKPSPQSSPAARKRPREEEGAAGGAAPPPAAAAAAAAAGKRKGSSSKGTWVSLRRGEEAGWVASRTQDSEWEEGLAEWERLVRFEEGRTGAVFRDTQFCGMKSITGRESSSSKKGGGGSGGEEGGGPSVCKCGSKAKLCHVSCLACGFCGNDCGDLTFDSSPP